jgi:hypothetical protein
MIWERIRAVFAVGSAVASANGTATALADAESGLDSRHAIAVGAGGVALASTAAVADASGGDSNFAFAS